MQIVHAKEYVEPRDALAQDWITFMDSIFPSSQWVSIPNKGKDVVRFCSNWELDALIFSGGNDVGAEPLRDVSEKCLLEYAINECIPVLGICRGLHIFQSYFGGNTEKCNKKIHVANNHPINLKQQLIPIKLNESTVNVNSFHNWGIQQKSLAEPLIPFALSEDGLVEGVLCKEISILAVQWHPERNAPVNTFDRDLINSFFAECTEKKK